MPWTGAAAFVAAISSSIWLRRFGPVGKRAGSLIALPFVVLLVTPHFHATRVSHAMALALPILVALLALLWVSVFHAVAGRIGGLRPGRFAAPVAPTPTPTPTRAGGLRPSASTRMAAQMAVALGAAFATGTLFFAAHWAWVVLTAFIVGSGNHGRLDVVYKSVLRVLGAAAGTVVALALADRLGPPDATSAAFALVAVFLGVWLRPVGYAWWALFVTLALALLQGVDGASVRDVLAPRLLEIVIGALIGVAAAWFVWPVRSTDVLRRRIADALAALAEAADPATPACSAAAFEAQLEGIARIAAPFRAVRIATRRWRDVQPADWIDALMACRTSAIAMATHGAAPGRVRVAIGAARKAMREPERIGPALADLRAAMAAAFAG